MGVACDKDPKPVNGGENGNEQGETLTELNGTKIDSENNLIGIVKDNTGKPLAGVPVTDGYSYVVTDANGVYQIKASRYARKAYLSIPSGYEVPLDEKTHTPLFYSPGTIIRAKQNRHDFTLKPLSKSEDKITLVMVSDPQCQTDSEVSRYKNETIADIQNVLTSGAAKYVNPYAFTLGDVTFDSNNLFDSMKETMSNMRYGTNYLPFFQCIGNHDHSSVESTDLAATGLFFEHFGPTDYSLDRGNVHIVVMDNILCTSPKKNSSPNKATWDYDAGFTAAQYKWFQEDLALVKNKHQKMIVLCVHIPFCTTQGAYYKEFLTAMKEFKEAHIMIGHTHYARNYIHSSYRTKSGLPVYEHIHGAACGGWWSCNLNTDGTPNGYYLYEVDAKNATMINWKAKYTNQNADYQMRVYDGNAVYGSKYIYDWITTTNGGAGARNVGGTANIFAKGNAKFKDAIIAAIWNDDNTNWKVEYVKDGVVKGEFKRLGDGSSCDILVTSFFFNELGKNTSTWAKSTVSHFWYYVPESKDPSSETNWEVRATQTVPSAGTEATNVYSCSSFTSSTAGF